jgi:hypothetical protein
MKLTAFISTLFIIGLVLSCNEQQKEPVPGQNLPKTNSTNCYSYITSKDTVILKTTNANGMVSGSLFYNLYQKDKNSGTIKGKMKGDLLIADYSFNSEGVLSVRQIAFKKTGNTFVEGYGESEEKNGKMIFKNADSLDFSHSFKLVAYDCEN